MSDFGNKLASYRAAVERGDFAAALAAARKLPNVNLVDALGLTVLAAQAAPDRFDSLARRWLVRLVSEREPPLPAIAVVAQLLANVSEGALGAEKLLAPLSRVLAGKPVG